MSPQPVKRHLSEFGELLPAEHKLLDQIDTGLVVSIGDGELPPEDAPEDRRIRASFLRYLLLGGCDEMQGRIHEKGVRVRGAYILGDGSEGAETRGLDLEGCRIPSDAVLFDCRFDALLILRSARISNFVLDDADFPGLKADGLEARGGVSLRRATVRGEASLVGARLAGILDCDGATFEWSGGDALNLAGMEVSGDVFLRIAVVRGEANLIGIKVGNNLECDGAIFSCPGGRALDMDNAEIHGAFFLRGETHIEGVLDLTAASIGIMNDHADSWPDTGNLMLDRCRYGAFTGTGPIDAQSRLNWLARQNPARWGADFWPQPYEQLAKVLREMGHGHDARAVLIEKERLQRRARRARMGAVWRGVYFVLDGVVRVTVRYGRQPLWAFVWLAGFWLLGVGIFHDAERNDAIKPNNAFVLRADEWALCAHPESTETGHTGGGRARPGQSQLACFREQPEARKYPRFNAWIYSLDTLLPVVEMEMQSFWIPDEAADWEWASMTRYYLWLHIAVGWALSLLVIAGFSGLVKTD